MLPMSDPLASSPLSYNRVGVDRLQVSYAGRPVSIVHGAAASAAVARLETAGEGESQRILASLMSARKGKRR